MCPSAKTCDQCGGTYFNVYAHAEECPGKVPHTKPCQGITGGHIRYYCSLPQGHKGPHRA